MIVCSKFSQFDWRVTKSDGSLARQLGKFSIPNKIESDKVISGAGKLWPGEFA